MVEGLILALLTARILNQIFFRQKAVFSRMQEKVRWDERTWPLLMGRFFQVNSRWFPQSGTLSQEAPFLDQNRESFQLPPLPTWKSFLFLKRRLSAFSFSALWISSFFRYPIKLDEDGLRSLLDLDLPPSGVHNKNFWVATLNTGGEPFPFREQLFFPFSFLLALPASGAWYAMSSLSPG